MKRLIALSLFLSIQGCAWMFHTVDDQGRLIDADGNFRGYANNYSAPFGGYTATCTVRDAGRGAFTARCW